MISCPACSGKRLFERTRNRVRYQECRRCGAVLSDGMYKCDRSELVLPYWADPNELKATSPEKLRYYDLTLLGSKGIERVHGWFNPESKRIHQVG